MADVEASKSLSGLLNGIAQKVYYSNSEITEELLKDELYPELSQEEFTALHEKMKALIKMKRQGSGGLGAEQAAALSRFWKSQRVRVRESLLSQSRWEPGLRGLSWRVDLHTAASRGDAAQSGPVALMELELGRAGQFILFVTGFVSKSSADSEFVCLEFDEAKVNQVLKKMSDIQQSIDRIVPRT
ncbi:hypothetical protein JOQ06_025963 [Pogonophryne albipinna]|uniref:COMM domain-containing protein 1 n=1 Tax=Pogonophryne albipinna TaxID=1090488 RepID=A0AAD6AA71_9TELE|nr:hypothetical protein JOQ06_025963 [Pogonophryne albipinna]